VPNAYQFGGRWGVSDDGSGLNYMRARHYSPADGRFVSVDPQGWGLYSDYAYAQNNPLKFNDPTGAAALSAQQLDSYIQNKMNFGQDLTQRANRAGNAPTLMGSAPLTPPESFVDKVFTYGNIFLSYFSATGPDVTTPVSTLASAAPGTAVGVFSLVGERSQLEAIEASINPPKVGDENSVPPPPYTPSSPTSGTSNPNNPSGPYFPRPTCGTCPGNYTPGGTSPTLVVQTTDPNDFVGPAGYGAAGYISPNATLFYTIDFENVPTATAAVQWLGISDPLNTNFDWSTFQLRQIAFNSIEVDVPPGLQNFTTNVYVGTDPNPVQVTVSLDRATGQVVWQMQSIDPTTGRLVQDPLAGFLPPDNAQQQGSGSVSYTIRLAPGIASGTQITGQASVVFDVNAPLLTPTTTNTIDSVPPTSSVSPLPAVTTSTTFAVSWSSYDAGSGVADYSVFVATNNGPWALWQSSTTNLSARFTGVVGYSYSFYSLATDNVGNVENKGPHAEATTLVTAPVNAPSLSGAWPMGGPFELTIKGAAGSTNVVQVSTNLIEWSDLTTIINTNGSIQLSDPASKTLPARYYRVKLTGP
jgi:RHS repeat-associated protein